MVRKMLNSVRSSSIDRIYIIDHSSKGNISDVLPKDDRIIYIKRENDGYGAGNNVAIRKSIEDRFDFHLVLNPDVYWNGDLIKEIADYMNLHEDTALLMPRILYPDGRFQFQAKLLPTPFSLICKRFGFGRMKRSVVDKYELRNVDYRDKIQNIPYLSGSFMFLRLSALKEIGLFDERFFLYPEDIDLTRRLHAKYRTIYYPHVTVYHHLDRKSARNLRLFFVHVVNMARYFNKWGWFKDTQRRRINTETLNNLNRS